MLTSFDEVQPGFNISIPLWWLMKIIFCIAPKVGTTSFLLFQYKMVSNEFFCFVAVFVAGVDSSQSQKEVVSIVSI